MLKKLLHIGFTVLLVAAIAVAYAFSNHKNSLHQSDQLEIIFEGNENLYTNEQMVNKLLIQKLEASQKQGKEQLVLNRLEKFLLEDPMLESVQVYRTVAGELRANIAQRKPIARVVSKSSVFYLDRLGSTMPLSKMHSANVPIITGKVNSSTLKDCYSILQFAENDRFLKANVVGIQIQDSDEYLLKIRDNYFDVYIGNARALPLKTAKLKAFYNKVRKDNKVSDYKKVDVSFDQLVVGTKR